MASEPSNISATSQDQAEDQGDSSNSKKAVITKEIEQDQSSNLNSNSKKAVTAKEIEQDQFSNSNSNKPIDFLRLSKENSVAELKVQKHNFLGPVKVGSSSCFPNNNNEEKYKNNSDENKSDSKSFSYSFCMRKFSTSQALGGHQNAHKAERALEKQRKLRYDSGALGLGQANFNPYYSYPSTLYTPPYYRALGAGMESLIQKPSYFKPRIGPYSLGFSHGALCLQETINPSLVSLRNMGGADSGAGNLGIGGASTLRIQDGTNNQIDAILKFGDSSTSVATSSYLNIENKITVAPTTTTTTTTTTITTKNDIHQPNSNNKEEISNNYQESSKLDLSLKL